MRPEQHAAVARGLLASASDRKIDDESERVEADSLTLRSIAHAILARPKPLATSVAAKHAAEATRLLAIVSSAYKWDDVDLAHCDRLVARAHVHALLANAGQ